MDNKMVSMNELYDCIKNIKIMYPEKIHSNDEKYVSFLQAKISDIIVDIRFPKIDEYELDQETKEVRGIVDTVTFGCIKDIVNDIRIYSNDRKKSYDIKILEKILPNSYNNILLDLFITTYECIKKGLPVTTEMILVYIWKKHKSDNNQDKLIVEIIKLLPITNALLYKLKKSKLHVMTIDEYYDSEENIRYLLNACNETGDIVQEVVNLIEKQTGVYQSNSRGVYKVIENILFDMYILQGICYDTKPQKYLQYIKKNLSMHTDEEDPLSLTMNTMRSVLLCTDR